jgi:hypothetical protein
MIGFNLLGNLGRLGNQMFQYASLRGIAENNGYEWCIPPSDIFGNIDTNVKYSDTTIYKCFNLHTTKNFKLIDGDTVNESFFHFDKDLFNNCRDNISLKGYFQSEKYFKHIEDDIRKDFSFNENTINLAKEFLFEIGSYDVISLHIRRGDYLNYSHHPTQSLEYYSKSLEKLNSDLPVIIFSDDTNWVKNQSLFSSNRFLISENNTTEFDLCLMSLCSHHIIANSSFSWWGAWLAKGNKKVIAPKNWFGDAFVNYNMEDLYCPNWIIL